MGFFFWFFCSILVVALVLLLFPFSLRMEFEAGERGARALFFFFKKKVYEYKKSWGNGKFEIQNSELRNETRVTQTTTKDENGLTSSPTLCHPEQRTKGAKSKDLEPRNEEESSAIDDKFSETNAVAKAPKSSTTEKMTASATDDKKNAKSEKKVPIEVEPLQNDHDVIQEGGKRQLIESKDGGDKPAVKAVLEETTKKKKKEKRKLSDREFWTILLTPDLDARAFRYALKMITAVFSLFQIRFINCFIEGIRMDYQSMGYTAAVNGILKGFPYVRDWDLRMDWCHEKELRAAGTVCLSITLLRIFCFVLETLVFAGILGLSFWHRRSRVIKTNELPELDFIRKKIIDVILED